MSRSSVLRGPSLAELLHALPNPLPLPDHTVVAAAAVPEPFHTLLVHDQHMTETMERYHGSPVVVRVQQSGRHGSWYVRQIQLLKAGTPTVVQGGVIRVDLDVCHPTVRKAILREDTPLGHILMGHRVLRRIEPTAYLRIEPNLAFREWLDLQGTTYGRLGIIHTDERPAIQLFEIVRL